MRKHISFFTFLLFSFTSLHATPALTSTWVATVEHNRSFDIYKINFTADGRCIVNVSNDNSSQETTGNWSYDGSLFRLNATFRNAQLEYLPSIAWSSVINFSSDNNSFNILGRTATNETPVRITFFRSDDNFTTTFNENAIPQIFGTLTQNIPQRSRLAIVGVTAADSNESTFYLNQLTLHFVNSRRFTIVERSDIDKILSELNIQRTVLFDNDVSVSFGKFIGATVVITGSITGTGSQKRLTVKAIDVLTSEILGMASASLE